MTDIPSFGCPLLPVSSLHRTRLNGGMANCSIPTPRARNLPDRRALPPSSSIFLTIGSTSFGGGLTGWMRRELVEKRGWLDDQQFLANYGLSQMVPGATNVNLAVLIGAQLRGAVGALTALAGLLLVPLAILLARRLLLRRARGAAARRC